MDVEKYAVRPHSQAHIHRRPNRDLLGRLSTTVILPMTSPAWTSVRCRGWGSSGSVTLAAYTAESLWSRWEVLVDVLVE